MLTLTQPAFEKAVAELAARVAASGFRPDIIIGIAHGGLYVLDAYPAPAEARRFSLTLRRKSSGLKDRLLPALLRHMPRALCDLLRVAESRTYALLNRLRPPKPTVVRLSGEISDALTDARTVLILDDAVDSGATLRAVRDAAACAAPDACIRTAVITVTRPAPLIAPDYHLHDTLVRFPWAPDF